GFRHLEDGAGRGLNLSADGVDTPCSQASSRLRYPRKYPHDFAAWPLGGLSRTRLGFGKERRFRPGEGKMATAADAALMGTIAGSVGAWVGGFIVPMAVAYVMLRFAGAPMRKPRTALALRIAAVVLAGFSVYASYIGSGRTEI